MTWKKVIINQSEYATFDVIVISNMKAAVIEIKQYQLKNILIKLDHI